MFKKQNFPYLLELNKETKKKKNKYYQVELI